MLKLCLFLLVCLFSPLAEATKYYQRQGMRPLIIGHRGAFGYFPEHTLAAYTQAYFDGANFIDVDIQVTKDQQLIVHHDLCLTSDLEGQDLYPEIFKESMRVNFTNDFNGDYYENDLMVADFTLDEIKLLTRAQRYHETRSTQMDKIFNVLTLNETINLVRNLNQNPLSSQGPMGIYIEIKSPEYYSKERQMEVNQLVLNTLKTYGIETYEKAEQSLVPIIIQSFHMSSLQYFKSRTNLPTAFLITVSAFNNWRMGELSEARVIDIIGVEWPFVKKINHELNNYGADSLANIAHQNGLLVHIFTAKDDFLKYSKESSIEEYEFYVNQGIDGIFTEFPRSAKLAFDYFFRSNNLRNNCAI